MTKNIRILLVDDDSSFRALASRLLRKNKLGEYEVTEAENAKAALAKVTQDSFDCFLVDYRLPDMFGADLISSLRGKLRRPIPAMLLSAEGSEELLAHIQNMEHLVYFPKSDVSRLGLHEALRSLLDRSNTRQQPATQTMYRERMTNHSG